MVKLTWKESVWEFGQQQSDAMEDLKQALLTSPVLQAVDYESKVPVILAVDTSYIAVSYILSQEDLANPQLCYHARFGSITLKK